MSRFIGARPFSERGAMRPPLAFEGLESRLLLSVGRADLRAAAAGIIGTISGEVTNNATGKPVKGDKIVLYNGSGRIVATTKTNSNGQYQFGITTDGPYVVRQFTPNGYVQTSPTFSNTPLVPDPAATSPFQSPINITAKPINLSTVLQIGYAPVNSPGGSTDHNDKVTVTPSNADYVTAGGTIYQLTQFHMHSPSETLVKGRSSKLEIHFVNVSAQGGVSVLAVFVNLGAHNYALDPILNAMKQVTDTPSASLSVQGPINLAGLLPTNMQGWFYQGSLTTSPYSGPLNFFVFQKPITLSIDQFNTYLAFAKAEGEYPNARPTQLLNGRLVNMLNNQVDFEGASLTNENFSIAPKM